MMMNLHRVFRFEDLVTSRTKKARNITLETLNFAKVHQFSITMLDTFTDAMNYHKGVDKRLVLLESIHPDGCYFVQRTKLVIYYLYQLITIDTSRIENNISQKSLDYGLE